MVYAVICVLVYFCLQGV